MSRAGTSSIEFYTNFVSVLYSLQDITAYLCDIATVQHPLLINAPDEMMPEDICSMPGVCKLESLGYSPVLIA